MTCKHERMDEMDDRRCQCRGCREFWPSRALWAEAFVATNGGSIKTNEVKSIEPVMGANKAFVMRLVPRG